MPECLYRVACGKEGFDDCPCDFYFPMSDYSRLSCPDQQQLASYRISLEQRQKAYYEIIKDFKDD